ncbi:MAG: hypothetical protein N2319_12475 [Candidatus Kapabacteria bacterium]|nr:hypothetical protein [Candidatus Kapabacteria bacterium]
MSATPVLDDFDMNYSEILKGRLENVISLPTGLNSNHRGYAVYYASRIWVWNGLQWITWDSLPWSYEDNDALDSNNPRDEITPFNATSYYLDGSNTNPWNINISEGYDDNVARTIGTLHFIGTTRIISDWQTIRGRRFVYTAKDGSWFNIKNLSINTVPTNHKRIDTRTDTDLTELIKAEFSYSPTSDVWILVSFERKMNTAQQSSGQSQCCKQEIYYELISVVGGDKLQLGGVPNGLLTSGDDCSYFQVHIQGEWSVEPMDNDEGLDFQGVPLYCQFLIRQDENSAWNIVKSVRYNWQSGETIYFDEEFIYLNTGSFYVGCSFSDEEFGNGHTVYPIQNFERFWIRMNVVKCPKTSWFNRYDILSTGVVPLSQFIGYAPSPIGEGLPFDGYYEVMAFVEFKEYESNRINTASCVSSQTLELMAPMDNWRLVDKSGVISVTATHEDVKWFNFSLQGSVIIFAQSNICGSRAVSYRVTLPNGSFRQILGGYIHVKYLGTIEGLNCKEVQQGGQ